MIAWHSAGAVLTLLIAAGAGALLARRGVLHAGAVRELSRLTLFLFLPCLLFSKILGAISINALREFWIFPLAAALHIGVALPLGMLLARLACPRTELRRPLSTAVAFANSGYAPLSLIAALTLQGAALFATPDAEDTAIAFISLYLIAYSPLLWLVGLRFLAGAQRDCPTTSLVPPPVYAALAAILLGLIPWTKALFIGAFAPLGMAYRAADILGRATVPATLVILGANLALRSAEGSVRPAMVAAVATGRFLLVPLTCLGLIMLARYLGWQPAPMVVFVLIIEACMPPAMNLIVMCEVLGHGRRTMAGLMFWMYLLAIPAMAVWLWVILRVC